MHLWMHSHFNMKIAIGTNWPFLKLIDFRSLFTTDLRTVRDRGIQNFLRIIALTM